MKNYLLLTACLIIALLVSVSAKPSAPAGVWEYKFEFNVNEKKANQLGAQGWELVAIGAAGSGPTSNVETYVFRRSK